MGANRDWKLFGSSYIAGLIGYDENYPTSTPIEIWKAMTGKPTEKKFDQRMFMGNLIETPIIRTFERDFDIELEINKTIIKDRLCSTPDGINEQQGVLLEVKNVGADTLYKWTDGVPLPIQAQCQWHCGISNLVLGNKFNVCNLRILVGGNQIRDEVIKYNQSLFENLMKIAEDFINNYVKTDTPPPPDSTKAYGQFLLEKFPTSDKVEKKHLIEADEDADKALSEYLDIKAAMDKLSERKEYLSNLLKDRIGDNYGVMGTEARAIWYPISGSTNYKKALDLIIEKYQLNKDEIVLFLKDPVVKNKSARGFRVYPKK